MENYIIYVLLGVTGLVMIIGVAILRAWYRRPIDYRAMFFMGIAWILLGFLTGHHALIPIGIMFAIFGYKHKAKWQENKFRWSDLGPTERRAKILFLVTVLVLITSLVLLLP